MFLYNLKLTQENRSHFVQSAVDILELDYKVFPRSLILCS